jgi:hypothetical protein
MEIDKFDDWWTENDLSSSDMINRSACRYLWNDAEKAGINSQEELVRQTNFAFDYNFGLLQEAGNNLRVSQKQLADKAAVIAELHEENRKLRQYNAQLQYALEQSEASFLTPNAKVRGGR